MERIKDIKLIVCDIDGTLLHDDKEMDEHFQEVLCLARKKGILFTFASGRNVHIMKDYVKQFTLDIPYITNNGANVFLKDTCIYEKDIEHDDLLEILNLLEKYDVEYLAYTNQDVYAPKEGEALQNFMNRLRGKVDIHINTSSKEIANQDIFKIVINEEDEVCMQSLIKEVSMCCKDTYCTRSEGNIYAINHKVVSKGNALQFLLEELQLTRDEVIVFGDNYNDLSMFPVAKYAVAMGNSNYEIKLKATHVAATNNENGVSKFIKEYIL